MAIYNCDIPSLVADAAYYGFDGVDEIDAQSLRVYILALILKELGGADYTSDICSLAESMKQYDGLPAYSLQSANLMALIRLAQNFDVDAPADEAEVRRLISCGHCCQISPQSMRTAETRLWCLIGNEYSRI